MTNRSDDRKCDNATLRSHGARSKFQLDRHATLNVRGGHGGHGAAFLVTRRVARHVLHLSGRTLRGGFHPAGTYARRPTLASHGTLECRRVREISRKWGAHVREAGTAVRPGSSTRGPFDSSRLARTTLEPAPSRYTRVSSRSHRTSPAHASTSTAINTPPADPPSPAP